MSDVVARHEAAHVAACIMLRRPVDRVRLALDPRDGGLTESFGKLDEDEQVVLLAAVLFEPGITFHGARANSDLAKAKAIGNTDRATERASAMIRTAKFRRIVATVTPFLTRGCDLTGAEILMLLDPRDGAEFLLPLRPTTVKLQGTSR